MLVLEDVSKSYGSKIILNALSFEIKCGEIIGFVGLNGSGKTTTMRCILGITSMSGGRITNSDSTGARGSVVKNSIGYMPEERGLFQNETVLENLTYFGELKGLSHEILSGRIDVMLREFNMAEFSQVKIKNLSLGNQQRIQLIATMLHKPQYLLLDEPFSGLDPIGTAQLAKYLQRVAGEGVGILLSSHILEHVNLICDRALLLNQGRIEAEFLNDSGLRNPDGLTIADYYLIIEQDENI
jgi:ABC-2 type transport system ATP-binding protein